MKQLFLISILFLTRMNYVISQPCGAGSFFQYLDVNAYLNNCNCTFAPYFLFQSVSCNNSSYTLAFNDEFNGTTLDLSKWQIQDWGQGALQGSASQEYYSLNNVYVDGGVCHIIAKQETIIAKAVDYKGDNDTLSDGLPNLRNYNFTSSNIWTLNAFSFGKYEIRAKLPDGAGLWPAFWTYGGNRWNEIDIFDNYAGVNNIVTSIGYDYDGDGEAEGCHQTFSGFDFTQWHTFTCIYDNDRITWEVDGNIVRTTYRFRTLSNQIILCDDNIAQGTYGVLKSFPIEPMHIILNLAVGSGLGPSSAPNSSTVFPSSFDIDYVRFYEKNGPHPPRCDGLDFSVNQAISNSGQNNIVAENSITTVGNINQVYSSNWIAGQDIFINSEFLVNPGIEFSAIIKECSYTNFRVRNSLDSTYTSVQFKTDSNSFISNDNWAIIENLSNNELQLKIYLKKDERLLISIIDCMGKLVRSEENYFHKGINYFQVNKEFLAKGLYIIYFPEFNIHSLKFEVQ